MRYKDARIENGKIYGVKFSEYFTVQVGNDNPSIRPVVNFDHMPVEVLIKLAFDSMKVKGRPAMKRMDVETLEKVYEGELSWRVMLSKDGAAQRQAQTEMSDDELEDEIERLKARRAAQRKVEPAEEPAESSDLPSDDINSDSYVPGKSS